MMKGSGLVAVLLILLFLCRETLVAQNVWALDQCIQYAWEHNYSIRSQEIEVNISNTGYRQARNDLLPELSIQSYGNQNFGRTIDPATNEYVGVRFYNNTYGISSSLELFNSFVKLNTIEMQRYNFLAEKNKLQQRKNEVAFAVINSYFNVLLQQGLFSISRETFRLSKVLKESTSAFVDAGRKAGSDLLEAEANMASDSFFLVQSSHLMEQAILDLKYEMNLPPAGDLLIDSLGLFLFSGNPDTLSAEVLFNFATEALPEVEVARNQVLAAKKAVQISRGMFSPRIGLYAGWNSQFMETNRDMNNIIIPFNDQISNNASEYFSLGIDIPLFSRFSKYSSLSRSKLRYRQVKLQFDEVSYKLRMNIEKSLAEWRSARAEYASSMKQLAASRMAWEAAGKKLDKGLISLIEYSMQKNLWNKARTEVLRTGLQALLKEKYIRFLMTGSILEKQ